MLKFSKKSIPTEYRKYEVVNDFECESIHIGMFVFISEFSVHSAALSWNGWNFCATLENSSHVPCQLC